MITVCSLIDPISSAGFTSSHLTSVFLQRLSIAVPAEFLSSPQFSFDAWHLFVVKKLHRLAHLVGRSISNFIYSKIEPVAPLHQVASFPVKVYAITVHGVALFWWACCNPQNCFASCLTLLIMDLQELKPLITLILLAMSRNKGKKGQRHSLVEGRQRVRAKNIVTASISFFAISVNIALKFTIRSGNEILTLRTDWQQTLCPIVLF